MCGNDCQKKMFVAVFVGQHGGEKEKKLTQWIQIIWPVDEL